MKDIYEKINKVNPSEQVAEKESQFFNTYSGNDKLKVCLFNHFLNYFLTLNSHYAHHI